jgi:hypothetical protein
VDSAVNGNKVTALMKPRVVKRQKINKKIYNLSGSGKCYKNKSHGLREWGGVHLLQMGREEVSDKMELKQT